MFTAEGQTMLSHLDFQRSLINYFLKPITQSGRHRHGASDYLPGQRRIPVLSLDHANQRIKKITVQTNWLLFSRPSASHSSRRH
jgi:hypothetical protein